MELILSEISTLSWWEYALGGMLLLAFFYQFYFYMRYMSAIFRQRRRLRKGKLAVREDQPPVAVIVCAHNEADNLENFLHALLEQDYPDFEVIVVNDGSEDETQMVLSRYQQAYGDRLCLTFVPLDAAILSSKKLAITLAAKAARSHGKQYLLLTDADCRPVSKFWIRDMMRGFTPGTKIVLGYGAYFQEPTSLNHWITYDTLFVGMQYLGMALSRHPYMGVGRNLAYTTETFFEHKGFADILDHRSGDDDLFVNRIANRHNTNVVATPESVTYSMPKQDMHDWMSQKERHMSVSPSYKKSSKFRIGLEPVMRGLFYLNLILLCALTRRWLVWAAAGLLFALRLLWQLIVMNRGARHFGQQSIGLGLLVYDMSLPIINLLALARWNMSPRRRQYWN